MIRSASKMASKDQLGVPENLAACGTTQGATAREALLSLVRDRADDIARLCTHTPKEAIRAACDALSR